MSTYELNFGVPYGVTTARVYLDVLTPVDADRQYVVGLRAMAGDRVVDLDSPGWHYSKHLQTKFCYLPRRSEPGMAKLPLLTVGREVTPSGGAAARLGAQDPHLSKRSSGLCGSRRRTRPEAPRSSRLSAVRKVRTMSEVDVWVVIGFKDWGHDRVAMAVTSIANVRRAPR